MPRPDIRPAEPRDLHVIVQLISELAEFENLSHLLEVTPESLAPHLFGDEPAAECVVGEVGGEVVAFALFYRNFSTFLSRPGLYLEDLYVRPAHRRSGLGRALLIHLAQLACERGYGRFDWTVLDWNEDAIRFYESLGADVMPEWRICRLAGDALERYSDGERPSRWSPSAWLGL